MNHDAVSKYLELQEKLLLDNHYSQLVHDYRNKSCLFRAVLAELEPRQCRLIEDYLGICVELHTKMLLLACDQ